MIGEQLVFMREGGSFLLPLSGLGTRLGAETKYSPSYLQQVLYELQKLDSGIYPALWTSVMDLYIAIP